MQYLMTLNLMLITSNNTSLLFGAYTMLNALTDDIKNELDAISETAKVKKNRPAIFVKLAQFIEFHSSVIQLRELKLK